MNKLDEQITSQQNINRPSDNAIGFTNVLRYGNVINLLGQQQINMNDGDIYMSVLEATHSTMNTLFVRSKELAVQAANDTVNHSQRLTINLEVRQHLESLVALAQTKHKEGFIFSGKWTNQPPYEIKNSDAIFYGAPNNVTVNPTPPIDPNNPLRPFEGAGPITISLLDSKYNDPNLSINPLDVYPAYTNEERNPVVQRIIPGSVSGLGDLIEKPYKNTDLPENHPDYDKPDYEIDYVNGTITLLSEKAKATFYDPDTGDIRFTYGPPPTGTPPSMSFEYVYRNSIDMSGEIYREIDNGITMKINTNPDDLFGKGKLDDTDSFKEIISLMQGLWYNDQPQISKGIETVDVARERNLKEQAVEGSKLSRLEIVFDRNVDLNITNTRSLSEIQDVNLEDVFMQFNMAKAIYDASLYAGANIMNRSLMDYL
jgi:flagellin-like hook-associated protein FlgL